MTRDEAINAASKHYGPDLISWGGTPAAIVDILVGLGLLKLDEPKTPQDKLHEQLRDRGWKAGLVDEFAECLGRAGLKIVEADKP